MPLDDLYRETILDYSRDARRRRDLPGATHTARGHNPLCGDDVTVHLRLDADRIAEATYTGHGCAICAASAAMLAESVTGRTAAEARHLVDAVETLVRTGEGDEEELGPLAALGGVHRYAARAKCATLPWRALQQALG